jgi:hypothetical protein
MAAKAAEARALARKIAEISGDGVAGPAGPPGADGKDGTTILYGTEDPPDPTGYADGSIYGRYK